MLGPGAARLTRHRLRVRVEPYSSARHQHNRDAVTPTGDTAAVGRRGNGCGAPPSCRVQRDAPQSVIEELERSLRDLGASKPDDPARNPSIVITPAARSSRTADFGDSILVRGGLCMTPEGRYVLDLLQRVPVLVDKLKREAFGDCTQIVQEASLHSVLEMYSMVSEIEHSVHRQVLKVQPSALPPLVMVPPRQHKTVLSYLRMLLFMLPMYVRRMTDLFRPEFIDRLPARDWATVCDPLELERLIALVERLRLYIRSSRSI
eukprot:tig00000144_g9000.t1